MNWNVYRTFVALCIVCGVIAPVAVGYFYGWNVLRSMAIQFTISVYAISTVVHFALQLIFAELNRRKVESIAKYYEQNSPISSIPDDLPNRSVIDIDENNTDVDIENKTENKNKHSISVAAKNELSTIEEHSTESYAIQIVGMNEDPVYFNQCLLHVKRIMQDSDCIKVIICIDAYDESMLSIAKETFDLDEINLQTPLQMMNLFDRNKVLSQITKRVICIQQPHMGKRYAMYTASWLIIHLGIKYVCMTDSDTLLDINAIKYLKQSIRMDEIAAVTGLVKIFNISNWLSLIIDIKYWCAFNIERAAQSYFGSVACISGPLGLYKCSVLNTILDKWVSQTFCGYPTTFGDDRHLTNLIISLGHKVTYNHKAICYTETPVTLMRWWAQQARWGRSFIREYLIGLRWIYRSYWLAYDMTYLVFYSGFLFVFACIGLSNLNMNTLLLTCLTTIVASGCRALYGLILTHDSKFVCFVIYGGVYFCWLLPLKVWSTFTMFITRWGTSPRIVKSSNYFDTWPVILWCMYVIYGIIHACLNAKIEIVSYMYISLICLMLSIAYIIYTSKKAILYKTQQQVFLANF